MDIYDIGFYYLLVGWIYALIRLHDTKQCPIVFMYHMFLFPYSIIKRIIQKRPLL